MQRALFIRLASSMLLLLTMTFESRAEEESVPFPLQQPVDSHQRLQRLRQLDQLTRVFNAAAIELETILSSLSSNSSSNITSLPGVSADCFDALKMIDVLGKGLIMLDAMGKPKAGLKEGALTWPGNFDQCLGIGMKHCMLSIPIPPMPPMPPIPISWGFCVPAQCNVTDATALANFAFSVVGKSPVQPGICRSNDDPAPTLSAGVIFFLMVIGAMGALTVVGTLYDYLAMDLRLFDSAEAEGWKEMGGVGDDVPASEFEKPKKDVNQFVKFILCFSMLTNGRKILSLAPASDNIGCINGIRFLSLTWVILGHVYGFSRFSLDNPLYAFTEVLKRVSFQPILQGTQSVDTFFVLSGLLTTYLFFKRNGEKTETHVQRIKTVGSMYLHRYLRLTPALGILMGFSMFLPLYMTSGPFGITEAALKNTCDKYWWYNILYINNFNLDAKNCQGHVWYLANDMQFFLISPIFLYSFKVSYLVGLIVSLIVWLASMACTIGITSSGSYGITSNDVAKDDFMGNIYIKPYTRIGPYIIGLVTGYMLYVARKEEKRHGRVTVVLGWMISAALALSVEYGLSHYYINGTVSSKSAKVIYLTFSRSAWAVAVSWMIYACATGYGGPVNTLLSWTPFGPVSRINYSAYLYHFILLFTVGQNLRSKMLYSDYFMAVIYCGCLLLSYGVAFLAALWFESPFIALEKFITGAATAGMGKAQTLHIQGQV